MQIIGSVGHPLRHTEFKIVDSETGKVLQPGENGIVKVRGPQIMKGYFKVLYDSFIAENIYRLFI